MRIAQAEQAAVDDEAHAVGAGVLFRLAEQIGQNTPAERADFADHGTGDRSGNGPAEGNELEGGSVTRAQCGEAEHEEQRRNEQ